ncbi:phosphoglycerate kinase [Streptomyces sp. NPDC094447]|uniref:phosphoglycerate kinase n=1 Tax=Streptomyces sp. NPDC094447 TaxID=3366062 RepID=UPI00382E9F98
MTSHEVYGGRPWSDVLSSTSLLHTLGDLSDDTLDGRRVLVTADIDVARRQTSNETHFKIARLAETVECLLRRNAAVLVLGAQGGTSVRVLEPGNTQGMEWHRKALARALPDGRAVTRFDRLADLASADLAPGTVALLPNLAELSREDAGSPSGEHALDEAPLPTMLRGHFDVFVLDDFRSTVRALPSNVGLAAHKPCAVGLGLQGDLESLARLLARSRALRADGLRSRVCFIGSSRPEDVTVAHSLLTADVFDRIALGPMPSLTVYRDMGYALGAGPTADLESLVQTHRAVLAPSAVPGLASDHYDRLVLPTDFMVANRAGRGKARRVTPEGLGDLAEDDRIMSIGPETLKSFAEETRRAGLIFHFGMMSSGQRPFVAYTEAVIRTNLESTAEVYMAGDHILEIAHDIGLVSALRGRSTGAQTASSLLSGVQVPGLAPFRKIGADLEPGEGGRSGDSDGASPRPE